MDAIFRKELGCLRPADEQAEHLLHGLKLGECIEVKTRKPRNLQQHRLFWKLMQTVCENQDHYKTPEEVCIAFKFGVGLTDKIKTKRGVVEIPKSISFAKMDQIAFGEFFKRAIDFCVAEVLPGIGSDELEREVLEMAA